MKAWLPLGLHGQVRDGVVRASRTGTVGGGCPTGPVAQEGCRHCQNHSKAVGRDRHLNFFPINVSIWPISTKAKGARKPRRSNFGKSVSWSINRAENWCEGKLNKQRRDFCVLLV